MHPKTLILYATGTNRDREAAEAFQLAGAQAEIVHLNELRSGAKRWRDYQILVLPGGFSYADALGAGKLWALELRSYFAEEVGAFVASGKPAIGICNGFQTLVKSGILPAVQDGARLTPAAQATLTFNASGHFECRWVSLLPRSQACLWTRALQEPIDCPVAHGEGNFLPASPQVTAALQSSDQIALVYARPDGLPAGGAYPYNPNGSHLDIAGVCNPQGNVLGLMPHPENHIHAFQHPLWTRGEWGRSGLPLFANGVEYARQM